MPEATTLLELVEQNEIATLNALNETTALTADFNSCDQLSSYSEKAYDVMEQGGGAIRGGMAIMAGTLVVGGALTSAGITGIMAVVIATGAGVAIVGVGAVAYGGYKLIHRATHDDLERDQMDQLGASTLTDCDIMGSWRAVHGVDQVEPDILNAVRDTETFKLLVENADEAELIRLTKFAYLEIERQEALTQEVRETMGIDIPQEDTQTLTQPELVHNLTM